MIRSIIWVDVLKSKLIGAKVILNITSNEWPKNLSQKFWLNKKQISDQTSDQISERIFCFTFVIFFVYFTESNKKFDQKILNLMKEWTQTFLSTIFSIMFLWLSQSIFIFPLIASLFASNTLIYCLSLRFWIPVLFLDDFDMFFSLQTFSQFLSYFW